METEDSIVISGVSGRFPQCDDIDELGEKLFAGIDLVTENDKRWPRGVFGLPVRNGIINDVDRFDAELFDLNEKAADHLKPSIRVLIETTYEALWDAGLNPHEKRSMKVAHFYGILEDEIDRSILPENREELGYFLRSENFINEIFDIKHGSYSYDTACSSSMTALHEAFVHLRHGLCDIAIVTASRLLFYPHFVVQYYRLGLLGKEGKCRFLDENASGYVKSEGVVSLVLQRKSSAKRIHCSILATGSNCDGYTLEGITFPKWQAQAALMEKTISKSKIAKEEISFVECHGTGTKEGDKAEITGLDNVFFKNQQNSGQKLTLGSVKSNLGHCENASGLVSIVKCLLMFKEKAVPPNIHFLSPSREISPLIEGRMKQVLAKTRFDSRFIPLSNYGFGGANCSVILGINDEKRPEKSQSSVLILCAARSSSNIEHMMQKIERLHHRNALNDHFANLINEYSQSVPYNKMTWRSFVSASKNEVVFSKISQVPFSTSRQLIYVFPGIGAQQSGSASIFMHIKCFYDSLLNSINYVDPVNEYKILDYLTRTDIAVDLKGFAFLAMAVFEIAFLDLLDELGLKPDGYFGHSFGEYIASYYDGFISRFELLDLTRKFCLSLTNDPSVGQKLASIGLPWNSIKSEAPDGIHVACFNSHSNVTVGGYTKVIDNYLDHLRSKEVFVREVKGATRAYHTPIFDSCWVKNIVKSLNLGNRVRTKKWMLAHDSSCKIVSNQEENATKLLAEILEKTVCFEKVCKSLPFDAVVVEVSPKSFLVPLLRENLSKDSTVICPVQKKFSENAYDYFLQQIGEIFKSGLSLKTEILFPNNFGPAPESTPFLSSLIKLDHSEQRLVKKYPEYFDYSSKRNQLGSIVLKENEVEDSLNYKISGTSVVPVSTLLRLVWQKLNTIQNLDQEGISVVFKNLIILNHLKIKDVNSISFQLEILPLSSMSLFKLFFEDNLLLKGSFKIDTTDSTRHSQLTASNEKYLDHEKLYQRLSTCGYEYSPKFQIIKKISTIGNYGTLEKNFDPFLELEAAIQLKLSLISQRCLLPQKIGRLQIWRQAKSEIFQKFFWYKNISLFTSSFISVANISFNRLPYESENSVIEFNSNFMKNGAILSKRPKVPSNDHPKCVLISAVKAYHDMDVNQSSKLALSATSNLPFTLVHVYNFQRFSLVYDTNTKRGDSITSFSGFNKQNQPIIGILRANDIFRICDVSSPIKENLFRWNIPSKWSLEEAARLPFTYCAVYFALMVKGSLQNGETVLIDSLSSDIGLAAIRICSSLNCKILTTLNENSVRKISKDLLVDIITISSIEDLISVVNDHTKGQGVDLYLNIDNRAQRLDPFVECVKNTGRFLQLSMESMMEDTEIGMAIFLKNINLIGVNYVDFLLSSLSGPSEKNDMGRYVHCLMQRGIDIGTVQPLVA